MTRILTIIALLFATPAWSGNLHLKVFRNGTPDLTVRVQQIDENTASINIPPTTRSFEGDEGMVFYFWGLLDGLVIGGYKFHKKFAVQKADFGDIYAILLVNFDGIEDGFYSVSSVQWRRAGKISKRQARKLSTQKLDISQTALSAMEKAIAVNKTLVDKASIQKVALEKERKAKEKRKAELEEIKKIELAKDARKKTLDGYRAECAEYGYASGSKELADCVKDLDIAAKQNEVLGEMKNRMERAEQEAARAKREAAAAKRSAAAAGVAAALAEKEASRASTQAIISNTIANQAKRDANTIPYGKDCPWLSGCKK